MLLLPDRERILRSPSAVDGMGVSHVEPYFAANKNNVDQTGIVLATWTKVTFPNEIVDVGDYYDAPNSRWTPPEGRYLLLSQATFLSTNVTDQMVVNLAAIRNGDTADPATRGSQVVTSAAAIGFSIFVAAFIDTPGSDFWEIWVQVSLGAGNKSIWGTPIYTYMNGVSVG